ncbi:glycosyltransferase [Methylohalobius crimeensis]|uniref:glycosyltransferase n=1 Tax=Methylohalobius crimeensis TaxID=244365 RepID=UPI0003B501D7|nr:glycosyltransferase [Methylohalobius crimeensis]
MEMPFVSIVIPALNCAHEVSDCIAALRAQDYPADRMEIIVADNGSTDDTVERLNELGVFTVVRRERGRSRALNAGLARARGEIILTTDVSCRPRRNWVSKVVQCFENPDVGCVAGEIEMLPTHSNLALRFQERNRYMSPLHAFSRRQLPHLPFADGANASFRRKVFEEIGAFEESFFKGADVEICYRLLILTDYKIVFCPDCVVEEPGEPDLKALLRQRFRMGMGTNLMQARFPAFFERNKEKISIKRCYWALRSRLGKIARFVYAAFRNDRATVEDAFVRYLMSIWQNMGKYYGVWYLKRQRSKPTPLDSERTTFFMESMDSLKYRIILIAGL